MIGRRLAHFNITSHLGSGGMGDVYQATDLKLDRSVALKFLPEVFAPNADRAARFAREAKMLASLNHPAIAAIYSLEEDEGRRFLVMELVPGDRLADRIGGRPLPWTLALDIARQIAEALEAAHEKGVVHRDLKPANVKITPAGQIKVLDFGLAKLVSEETTPGSDLTLSPTMSTVTATQAGVILGTPSYMAPEQAAGHAVDARADLFAFGCVLYEMLVGRPAFEGESVAEIISRVLEREPDWTRMPADVPPALRRLLRLCLEKDLKKRRQSAADVRVDLAHVQAEPAAPALVIRDRGSRVARLAWLVAGLAAIGALAVPTVTHLRESAPAEMRLQIVTPATRRPLDFALSPDGRYIVFVGSESSAGTDRLYLRSLDTIEPHPVAGTEGARLPFWSPDSRSVGYFAGDRLYRLDIGGGVPQSLAAASNPLGGAWSKDGTIVFAPDSVSPLFRVSASGGDAVAATKLDAPRQTNHRQPSFLPDGRQFLFYSVGSDPAVSGLYLASLDGTSPKRLMQADSGGAYLAPDRVVFLQRDTLVARRFDTAQSVLTGDPLSLATSVAAFSVSETGLVAHRAGGPTPAETAWFDHKGNLQNVLPAVMNGPEFSPDETRLLGDRTVDSNRDIWQLDLSRGSLTRVTTHPAIEGYPIYSRDGSRIAFHSARKGTLDLWIKPSSGAGDEELLLEQPVSEWPIHWSRDGRFLLYQRADLPKGQWDLWALPMTGAARTPFPVANTPFTERLGEFSPDGRWLAYDTDESGRPEVVVQSFPQASGKLVVSTAGGNAPRWNFAGTEIYFVALDGKLMVVPVHTKGSGLEFGTPAPLFDTHIAAQTFKHQYAVSRDGRFIINHLVAGTSAPPITVILNTRNN